MSRDELLKQIKQLDEQARADREALMRAKYMIGSMNSLQNRSLDDEYFCNQVQSLRSEIHQWSVKHVFTSDSYSRSSAEFRFAHLTKEYEAFLHSTEYRAVLLEAQIWDLLKHWIFNETSEKYGYIWSAGYAGQRLHLSERILGRTKLNNLQPLNTTFKEGAFRSLPDVLKTQNSR
jgi:hypothetical protein